MTGTRPEPDAAAFEVVSGHPTPDEIAALAVVLHLLGREQGRPPAPTNSHPAAGWASRWHQLNHGLLPGVTAWRTTFRR